VVKSKLVMTIAALSLLANIAAEAATLNPTGGTIFTRTGGQGFHRVTSTTEVQPGDTVMAAPDGSAQIVLSDGRVITVGPGQVVVVPQSSDRSGAGAIDPTYVLIGGAAAVGIGVGIYYATKGSGAPAPVSP
jgi:hypothetical protein